MGPFSFLRFGQKKQSEPESQKESQDQAEEQYQLGIKYAEGRGVVQDSSRAAQLFEAAAKAGHSGAQTALGWMYEQGRGVEKNYEAALGSVLN